MNDDKNPREDIHRAMQLMERGYLELAEGKLKPLLALPGLEGLIARAAHATNRIGHALYPSISFGHLSADAFACLLRVLGAEADEVTRRDDSENRSYIVVEALRHGVWFTGQRAAEMVTVEEVRS
jgi:hypothetical protein